MSVWTQVAAVIRIDALPFMEKENKIDLGRIISYEEVGDVETIIPTGSEGSLQHSLWVNPDKNSVAMYTITIWGSLRDFDDSQAILDYLTKIIGDRMVRQAVVEITVNGAAPEVYVYDDADYLRRFRRISNGA